MSALPVFKNSVLDMAQQMLCDGEIGDAVNSLVVGTRRLRDLMSPDDWNRFAGSEVRRHPTTRLIHQSPYTRRAFEKPRGYAGDAETLDFAYGCARLPEGTTKLGAQIYGFELQTSGSRSARARRDLLASMVDNVADQKRFPRVLSIACGHLREAQISKAVRDGLVGEYVAFDQDRLSLSFVDQEYRYACVKTISGSVRSLLTRRIEFSDFDFVYAAGLYDYLSEPVATKLTGLMFSMLASGGRLLVANFAPEWECIGYLEAFMDWHLIYRNEPEMEDLAKAIPEQEIRSLRTFRDPYQNIALLEIHKL